jgi:hypothetical protein
VTIDVERRKRSVTLDGINSDLTKILKVLGPRCKATFFVAGEVAEGNPDAVHGIAREGHEVGCHGLHHERFDVLELSEQVRRIDLATQAIKSATGTRPVGFRAPEHRANSATILALERLGYVYDASVLPRTPFMRPQPHKKWRFLFAPGGPYYPSRTNIARQGNSSIIELPCSALFLPFVSGVSMRSTLISNTLASLLVQKSKLYDAPVIYYLHSYDSSEGALVWLRELLATLQKHKVEFLKMNQLAVHFKRELENSE